MPTTKATVDHVLDVLQGLPTISARAMFGEYAVYCDGKVVALICDDRLFLKPTPAAVAAGLQETGAPYPGAKPHFLVDVDTMEDQQRLQALVAATAAALPQPKAKPKPARKRTNR